MGHVLFVLNNLLVFNLSFWIAIFIAEDREFWRKLIIAIANYALIIYGVVLLTGCVGILFPLPVTVILISLNLPVLPSLYRWYMEGKAHTPITTDLNQHRDKNNLLFFISMAMLSGFGAVIVIKALLLGTNFFWDDFYYHAAIPSKWLVDGKISLVNYFYQTYYPFNSELLSLWFMLPYHNDTFVSITGFYWTALSTTAIMAIVLANGSSATCSCFIGALFLASRAVQHTTQSFSSTDLSLAAMTLAAIALLFYTDSVSQHEKWTDTFYCGLLSGFAAGTKVSGVVVVLFLMFWLYFEQGKKLSLQKKGITLLLFIAGVLLTGGFWYIRNLIITGNPLFPAEFGPLKGPFTRELQYNTELISWIFNRQTTMKQYYYIVNSIMNWPLILAILATLGYISCLYYSIKKYLKRNALQSKNITQYKHQNLLFITGILTFIIFFVTPFSGGNSHKCWLIIYNRYIILPFAIGLILFANLVNERICGSLWKAFIVITLVYECINYYSGKILFAFILAGLASIFLWKLLHLKSFNRRVWFGFVTFSIVFSLIFITMRYNIKKYLTDSNVYRWYNSNFPFGRAWKEVEKLPEGSRIGYLVYASSANLNNYALLGRNLQLTPVALDADGSLTQYLHISWDWLGMYDFEEQEKRVDQHEFLSNLGKNSIQYILFTKGLAGRWPRHNTILEQAEHTEKIYDDGFSAIWKINNFEKNAH